MLDLREFEGDPVQEVLVHDADTIINDAEIAIVCETMGGEHPAYEFTKRALESGKSVYFQQGACGEAWSGADKDCKGAQVQLFI